MRSTTFGALWVGDRFMAHGQMWTRLDESTARQHCERSIALGDSGLAYIGDAVCSFERDDEVEFVAPGFVLVLRANAERLATEYQQWIDFHRAGLGGYDDFMRQRPAVDQPDADQRDAFEERRFASVQPRTARTPASPAAGAA
jgi:hypothetical protein